MALNGFEAPLPAMEVYCVARSVAEFVYYRYQPGTGNMELTPEYRAKQAERGRRGGLVSKGGGRPSLGSPWETMGISRATYFRRKKAGLL